MDRVAVPAVYWLITMLFVVGLFNVLMTTRSIFAKDFFPEMELKVGGDIGNFTSNNLGRDGTIRIHKNTREFKTYDREFLRGHAAWNIWPWKLHRIEMKKGVNARSLNLTEGNISKAEARALRK